MIFVCRIKKPTGNPLVLIMSWLMAKERHLKKYAGIYLELGFDVMVVHLTPWQLLWPTKGAQIVAGDVVKFLDSNSSYAPIVVHGFSVGAYLFGEVLLKIASNFDRLVVLFLENVLRGYWFYVVLTFIAIHTFLIAPLARFGIVLPTLPKYPLVCLSRCSQTTNECKTCYVITPCKRLVGS